MMKKQYLALAGVLVIALSAAGCGGNDKNNEGIVQEQATPTPEPTVTESVDLVDMEVTEEKNVIGEKTASAHKVTIINRTGSEVGAVYIRVHPEDDYDDEWGSDLIDGLFTLADGDQAVYYFEPESGSGVTYDIRITYTEEGRNECFFRDLPLASISQITLRMDGRGEDSIPYATYMTSTGSREVSTLNEVKQRLGLSDEDTDETEDTEDEIEPTEEPEITETPSNDEEEPSDSSDNTDTPEDPMPTDDTITEAEGYIGQSFSDLAGAIGDAQTNEYDEVPETGTTGYHYYPNFTVMTTVDEYGNEIVSGVY